MEPEGCVSLVVTGRVLTVSDSTRKRNPHLYGGAAVDAVAAPEHGTRIRQEREPVMNKLETQALAWLQARYPGTAFHCQAWRTKIANGAWFKVDICAVVAGRWTAWECKEFKGKNVDRGILALKTAAHQFPEVHWILLSRKDRQWCEQSVLP
jgi:hypothetical protein